MDNLFLRVIRQWIPLAVGITAVTFIIYLVIQQDIRIGANDPQIQMAEDLAATLNDGQTATTSDQIDVSKSLAPFTIIYDRQGNVTHSNAILNGQIPPIPKGALMNNKGTDLPGENRITWEPQQGVRLASVIVSYNKGYVLVGRNMREIEVREEHQFQIVNLTWMVSLVATLSCVIIMQTLIRKKK